MAKQQERVTLLLGAGASADAGLPLTSELAMAVVRAANDERESLGRIPEWARALNFVYSAMVGYQGLTGGDPLQAVNIETLISAIRLLRSRESHEVAPFVASWSAGLSDLGTSAPSSRHGRDLLTAIGRAAKGNSSSHASAISNSISDIAREAQGRSRANSSHGRRILSSIGDSIAAGGTEDRRAAQAVAAIASSTYRRNSAGAFDAAEEFILRTLVTLLGSPREVSYLYPLAQLAKEQPGGLDVLTLNYDLTVERAAAEQVVPVNRAIDDWIPGTALDFPARNGMLNLVKLHGSLDWTDSTSDERPRDPLLPPHIRAVDDQQRVRRPWIVVGDREKLATDGPTLALMSAARRILDRSTHLIVVGYSFSDEHINNAIRDWMAASETRTIGIVDPQWPAPPTSERSPGFRALLTTRFAGIGRERSGNAPRLVPIRGTAAVDLGEALRSRPAALGDPPLPASVSLVDGWVEVTLTLQAPTLEQTQVSAVHVENPQAPHLWGRSVRVRKEPEETSTEVAPGAYEIGTWERGTNCTLYVAESDLPVSLGVSGLTLAGPASFRLAIGAPNHTPR